MNFDHLVLNVLDMDKMILFYSDIMGLQIEGYDDYQSGKIPFPAARLSETQFMNLFPKEIWQDSSKVDNHIHMNMNHFCFSMKKLRWDDLLSKLKEKSIEIEAGPDRRDGASGLGTAISFRDPDHNLVEARHYD